ncbi:Prephenate dehydratase-domain-containing protein [Roridomyces roridus]|uniref:Prephenate dehydratase-domain-containing protein n=1 Tax=Roridomyces roridus TaxID=1738132 RepID=A0AAD7FQM0_9AGAR|nr:Prephenate dehydratase-domain-containing protein [Roridomyces roridus]
MSVDSDRLTVAFLGPLGTYTHQAAYSKFGSTVQYHECATINDVFDAVSTGVVHAGVVPQENSIFGPVVETYDALRQPNVGFVRAEIVLEVQHCLLVPSGSKREDVRFIKSHEQALGQCRGFLEQNFPSATLEKCTSTAAAAQAVLRTPNSAAICSKICATVFEGLEVLFEGIQDRSANCTRFYVLSTTQDGVLWAEPTPTRCLVRLSGRPISDMLAALALPVSRLDRRPQLGSEVVFLDVYFAEVETGDLCTIEQALQRIEASGAKGQLTGLW